ncbi:MAG: DUF7518 family protein [Natronomonas sp.]
MTGNRVEELENKVRALEATVEGLTDELVESKERLYAIEEEVGVRPDLPTNPPTETPDTGETEGATTASADAVNTKEVEGEDNADSGDDIIVA